MEPYTPEHLMDRRISLGVKRVKLAAEAEIAEATLWRLEMGKSTGTMANWRALYAALDRIEASR